MRINENQYNVGAERPVTFKQIKATSNDKRDELICTLRFRVQLALVQILVVEGFNFSCISSIPCDFDKSVDLYALGSFDLYS